MRPKATINWILLLLLCGCGGHAGDATKVTVYVSADEHIAREIFDAFTEQTGIDVLWVGDSEATKTTALVQRLLREKNDPVADVFWSSEILGSIQLANQNMFAIHRSIRSDAWPSRHRDVKQRWFGFSPRARVIAYDPIRTKKSELPNTWWEYTHAAIADPRFGTTGTHLSVMWTFQDKFTPFFESVTRHTFLGGNAATVQAVVNGTVEYAMTDSDDVYAAMDRGASIAMHFPRHHDEKGGGTLLIPNTVGIIQGCDHPIAAAVFVDFMLSDQVATLLAESASRNIPLQPSVARQFPELMVEDPLECDFYEAAQFRNEFMLTYKDRMRRDSEE